MVHTGRQNELFFRLGKLFPESSPCLPRQLGTGQQGRYTSGTLIKQFLPNLNVRFILSPSTQRGNPFLPSSIGHCIANPQWARTWAQNQQLRSQATHPSASIAGTMGPEEAECKHEAAAALLRYARAITHSAANLCTIATTV